MEKYKKLLTETQKEILAKSIGKSIDSWGIKIVNGASDYELMYISADKILLNIDSEVFIKLSYIERDTNIMQFTYFEPIIEEIEESEFDNTDGLCIMPPYNANIVSIEAYKETKKCPAAVAFYDGVIIIETEKGVKFRFIPQITMEDKEGVCLSIINPPNFYENVRKNLMEPFVETKVSYRIE